MSPGFRDVLCQTVCCQQHGYLCFCNNSKKRKENNEFITDFGGATKDYKYMKLKPEGIVSLILKLPNAHNLLQWTQNICEPKLRHSKGGKEDGKSKGQQDALCPVASPPFPYRGWLPTNLRVCNGQLSSATFAHVMFLLYLEIFSISNHIA